jgi:uncharacterized protein
MRQNFVYDESNGQDMVFRSQWTPLATMRKLPGRNWFVSAATGAWAVLSDDDASQLRSVAIRADLYDRLQLLGLILTKENALDVTEKNYAWTHTHYRHPVHHILVSTLRCNLSCSYCHAPVVPAKASHEYDLKEEIADKILAFALNSKATVQSFEFQGGESLLNAKMLQYIVPKIRAEYKQRDIEIYISVQTNGTLLADKIVHFLRSYDVRIGTSYDGVPSLHDLHRVTNKGQPTSIKVMNMISRHNLPYLPTLSRQSLYHWREIIDGQLGAGARTVSFQPVYPINSARENWETIGIDDETFLSAYREGALYMRSLWQDDKYPMERRMVLALRKLAEGRDVEFADFGSPCGMVHSQLLYDFNGDIYTCDEGRDFPEFKIGHVATSSYDEVVFGPGTRHLKSLSIPHDQECQTCAYRPVCSSCPVYERAVEGHLSSRHAGTRNCLHTKLIFDLLLEWIIENPTRLEKAAYYHGFKPGVHWAQAVRI